MRAHQCAAAVLMLVFASLSHAADVYRWVDAQGRVHYSDRPARNAEKVTVKVLGGVQEGQPAAAVPEDVAQGTKSPECERKQQQLERYRNAARIKETDGEGNEREYTPQEKQELIERTRREAEALCG